MMGTFGQQGDPQQGPQPPIGLLTQLLGRGMGGAGGGGSKGLGGSGGGGMSGLAGPGLFAALIGMGKNTEANHPNTAVGQGLLAGLGPSISQVAKDPVGMGLPTLFGLPFLTPFTSSKESQATKPEWSGLFNLGF